MKEETLDCLKTLNLEEFDVDFKMPKYTNSGLFLTFLSPSNLSEAQCSDL